LKHSGLAHEGGSEIVVDGAKTSSFSHLSWLGIDFSFAADDGPRSIHMQSVAHSVSLTVTGRHAVRFLYRGREQRWIENPGTVHFRPCDREWYDFIIHAIESGDVVAFFIPEGHLEELARADEAQSNVEWKRALLPNDAILQQEMRALAACRKAPAESVGRADEAARRLVLRLVELSGGGRPDWHGDASVFDRRTLGHLVEHIDAHLKVAPSLTDMGLRVGLSPSHFARKFRHSTGLSLHRFINRRRIQASLEQLKDTSQQLAAVALDLGFSSQSHFTRLFSDLTGMTPAKYQKQFRRRGGGALRDPPGGSPRGSSGRKGNFRGSDRQHGCDAPDGIRVPRVVSTDGRHRGRAPTRL